MTGRLALSYAVPPFDPFFINRFSLAISHIKPKRREDKTRHVCLSALKYRCFDIQNKATGRIEVCENSSYTSIRENKENTNFVMSRDRLAGMSRVWRPLCRHFLTFVQGGGGYNDGGYFSLSPKISMFLKVVIELPTFFCHKETGLILWNSDYGQGNPYAQQDTGYSAGGQGGYRQTAGGYSQLPSNGGGYGGTGNDYEMNSYNAAQSSGGSLNDFFSEVPPAVLDCSNCA